MLPEDLDTRLAEQLSGKLDVPADRIIMTSPKAEAEAAETKADHRSRVFVIQNLQLGGKAVHDAILKIIGPGIEITYGVERSFESELELSAGLTKGKQGCRLSVRYILGGNLMITTIESPKVE